MKAFSFLFVVFLFLFSVPSEGQKVDPVAFFKGDSIIELHLSGHLKMIDQPKEYGIKRPGYARMVFPDGTEYKETIEFTARGKSRFTYCDPPPLMLYFKNKNAGGLSKLGKLKLVWSCQAGDYYNRLILRELLVYKMYNLITPYSFRARLLNVTFYDSSRNGSLINRKGFLLEDIDDLAARQLCSEYQDSVIRPTETNRQVYALMALFQYMIGNTDWSIANYQNIKLIVSDTSAFFRPIPVPYDFDNCGFVDAEYAVPHESMPIENVRERYNKAMALTIEDIQQAATVFRNVKPLLLDLVAKFEGLTPADRRYMHLYLNSFFEEMKNLEKFSKIFEKPGN
jgi:hypothetical protein